MADRFIENMQTLLAAGDLLPAVELALTLGRAEDLAALVGRSVRLSQEIHRNPAIEAVMDYTGESPAEATTLLLSALATAFDAQVSDPPPVFRCWPAEAIDRLISLALREASANRYYDRKPHSARRFVHEMFMLVMNELPPPSSGEFRGWRWLWRGRTQHDSIEITADIRSSERGIATIPPYGRG